MTTLSANTPRVKVGGDVNEIPMIASDIIWEGAAVGVVAGTGHARPLTSVDKFVGFAESKVDNSAGAAAALNCRFAKDGVAKLSVSGAVITDIGQPVYATDDDTFVFLPVGAQFVGFVRRFVSSGIVEVEFDPARLVDPYGDKVRETLAASTLTADVNDSCKYVFATVTTVVTLPATSVGLLNYTLVNMGPFGTVEVSVDPNASDLLTGANLTPADGVVVKNTAATARRGDLITVNNGHANGPIISQLIGTWA